MGVSRLAGCQWVLVGHASKETYYKAKETYYEAKETYYLVGALLVVALLIYRWETTLGIMSFQYPPHLCKECGCLLQVLQ